MLNILNQPEENLKGLIISRARGLVNKKRGDRLLVINPENGTYVVFKEPFISIYKKTKNPILYREFIKNDDGVPPALFVAFMEEAFGKGIIHLSGRSSMDTGKKQNPVILPPLFYLQFMKKGGGYDFFHSLMKKKIYREMQGAYYIEIGGNISVEDPELPGFIRDVCCPDSDCSTRANVSIDINGHVNFDKIPGELAGLRPTLNFFMKGGKFSHEKRSETGEYQRILKDVESAVKKSIPPTLTIAFDDPGDVPGTIGDVLERGIFGIGIKIDPDYLLAERPMTEYLRSMQKFAEKSLEAVDWLYDRIAWSRKRVVLNDVQRFLTALLGRTYPYPCGRRPCGMGTQTFVFRDDGTTLACIPISGKTESVLKVNGGQFESSRFYESVKSLSARCSQCAWRHWCGGGCPVLTYEKYGSLDREDPRCRYFQVVFEELLWKLYDEPLLLRKTGGLP